MRLFVLQTVGLIRDEWGLYSHQENIILIAELRKLNKAVEDLVKNQTQQFEADKRTGIPWDSKMRPVGHLSHSTQFEVERMEKREARDGNK